MKLCESNTVSIRSVVALDLDTVSITCLRHIIVTQRQLMRLFVVTVILSNEQKCKVRSKFLKN